MPLDERVIYRLVFQEVERKLFLLQRKVEAYFDPATGHSHDGAPGEGGDLGTGASTAQDFVMGEDLSAQADEGKTVYQTLSAYLDGYLAVYLDGLRLHRGVDYTEDGANSAFTMAWEPLVGSSLIVDYIRQQRGGFGLIGFGSLSFGT